MKAIRVLLNASRCSDKADLSGRLIIGMSDGGKRRSTVKKTSIGLLYFYSNFRVKNQDCLRSSLIGCVFNKANLLQAFFFLACGLLENKFTSLFVYVQLHIQATEELLLNQFVFHC